MMKKQKMIDSQSALFSDKISMFAYGIINFFYKNCFSTSEKGAVAVWREKLFFSIYFSTIVISIFSLLSSIKLVLSLNLNINAILYIFIYLLLVAATFARAIPYHTKTIIGIVSFYLLGFIALVTIGPLSCGHIWLFTFSIVACLTKGFKIGLFSVVVNFITLNSISLMVKNKIIEWPYTILHSHEQLNAVNDSFIFITMVLVISLSMIIDNFERLLKRETDVAEALLDANKQYKKENYERKKTEEALKKSLQALSNTHEHLVQSEKMAAIGDLITGVTHELNTPIGVGVTASSFLEQKTSEVVHLNKTRTLSDEEITKYIRTASDTSSIIFENMNQVAGLIKIFDQLTIDQKNEKPRFFFLKEYIDEILVSIQIKTKKKKYDVQIHCSEGVKLRSYPGAFSQIITHLILNSVTHGFIGVESGIIILDITVQDKILNFHYYDNGCGMAEKDLKRIFDPFYTTKRNTGRSGLGMHIVYNIVTQLMNGEIECLSCPEKGMDVMIKVPVEVTKS